MATELLTLRTRLLQAEQAEHDLVTGQSVRKWVDQNGESVEYSMINIKGLQAYIARLRAEIAVAEGTASAYRGPIRFSFGRRRY